MSRCIVIHPTGATELLDFHPVVHQRLKGLGYRRFVIQFAQRADQRLLSAPVYSRVPPSAWQVSDAARKLWGPRAGAVSLVDEHGDALDDRLSSSPMAAGSDRASSDTSLAEVARPPVPAVPDEAMGHRMRSLVHHWLYLLDRNDGDAASFDELFAPRFELDWATNGIRTREQLASWFRGVAERVLTSRHTITELEFERLPDRRYSVRVELLWQGTSRSRPDEELEARTLHEWTVGHDPAERFARIERGTTRVLEPAHLRSR